HAVDVVPVGLGEVHDVGATGDASIVEEDVDLAEDGNRLDNHAIDVRHAAHVGLDGESFAPLRGYRCRRLLDTLFVDVDGHDICTRFGQGYRRRLADALAGA